MGLFSRIADRIFNRKNDDTPAPAPAANRPAPVIFEGSTSDPKVSPPARDPAPVAAATPAPAAEPVDVEAVLRQMAEAKGGESDWRRSIVDLLKLLDLDSSLAARRELAEELGVDAGAHGSAEQNIALHRAVMRKLAENGGTVPAELRD
jgi:8-oxo-dGTP pyrophosphatase MutT (NUDIX family)